MLSKKEEKKTIMFLNFVKKKKMYTYTQKKMMTESIPKCNQYYLW